MPKPTKPKAGMTGQKYIKEALKNAWTEGVMVGEAHIVDMLVEWWPPIRKELMTQWITEEARVGLQNIDDIIKQVRP